ncbi:unnamed protein product [Cyprideis torosa]|uniref:Alpha-1,3-mannosyl-glycoprotein 2-beta-N-acetylglucosaminyltransferase n=1 Tax=Cyprideis torosa TaxID=163714 RepID=A0A7R8WKP7_9CRUS|nr:unnamed protein product [Cyprideis torosa]CAG0897146.1 unnamed protein product [Cyprideis torosa]
MDDLKAGVPRTAYKGIVTVFFRGRRIFIVPPTSWKGYTVPPPPDKKRPLSEFYRRRDLIPGTFQGHRSQGVQLNVRQTANHSQAQSAADWFEGGVDSPRNSQFIQSQIMSALKPTGGLNSEASEGTSTIPVSLNAR